MQWGNSNTLINQRTKQIGELDSNEITNAREKSQMSRVCSSRGPCIITQAPKIQGKRKMNPTYSKQHAVTNPIKMDGKSREEKRKK